jgi:hypothetical protein
MSKNNILPAVPPNLAELIGDDAMQLIDDFADELYAMRFEIAYKTQEQGRAILERRLSPILQRFRRAHNIKDNTP